MEIKFAIKPKTEWPIGIGDKVKIKSEWHQRLDDWGLGYTTGICKTLRDSGYDPGEKDSRCNGFTFPLSYHDGSLPDDIMGVETDMGCFPIDSLERYSPPEKKVKVVKPLTTHSMGIKVKQKYAKQLLKDMEVLRKKYENKP